jgi:hypothetical protein
VNDAENLNHVADNAIENSMLSDHQLPKSRTHVVFGLSQLWVRLQRFKTGTQWSVQALLSGAADTPRRHADEGSISLAGRSSIRTRTTDRTPNAGRTTQPDEIVVSLLIAPDFCGIESDFDDVALGVFGNFEFERTVGHPDPPGCLVA